MKGFVLMLITTVSPVGTAVRRGIYMKKITGRLIFGAVMLAAVFFMSAFLVPAGVQAVEVDEYVELKNLLESNAP